MHLRSAKQKKGSTSGTGQAMNTPIIDSTMAAGNIPKSPTAIDEIDPETLPDRTLLLQIIKNQKEADKKSEERFASLRKQIKESKRTLEAYQVTTDKRVTETETAISTTVADMKQLHEKVTALELKLDTTSDLLEATQQQLDGAKKEINENALTLNKLNRKYEQDEEEIRRCTLILDGVNERDNKQPKIVIEKLLKDLTIDNKANNIKTAYRLGPLKNGVTRPRSIKVIFANSATKGEIFKNIGKLNQTDKWKGVRLSDAISPQEQSQQRDLRCIYAVAKAQGINVKLRGSSIIIEEVKYSYKDINNLPHNLSMENVKILRVADGIAFQSHHAFMSNMFACLIKADGQVFKSAEHFYSAEMAKFHKRDDLIQPIIDAKDGYLAKRIVRNIKVADEWQQEKMKVMKKVIKMKFDQNDSLRDRLLRTKGFLYEATKADLDFACGYTLSQTGEIKKDNLKGKNWLGNILCEYRDNILGKA